MNKRKDRLAGMIGNDLPDDVTAPPTLDEEREERGGRVLVYAPPPSPAASYVGLLEAEGFDVLLAKDPRAAETLLRAAPTRLILAVAPTIGPKMIELWEELAPGAEIRVFAGISNLLEQHLVPPADLLDFTIRSLAAASSFIGAEHSIPAERSARVLELSEAAASQLGLGMRQTAIVRLIAAFQGLGESLAETGPENETLVARPLSRSGQGTSATANLAESLGCPFNLDQIPSADEDRLPTPAEVVAAATELILLDENKVSKPGLALRRRTSGDRSDGPGGSGDSGTQLHAMAVEAVLGAFNAGRGAVHGEVLVIDPDAATRNLLSLRLSNEGFAVRTCSDGRAALEEVRRNPPSLILAETVLPGLDGYALLDALKGAGLSDVPFIFLSSRDDALSINKGLLLGARDYLTKPINHEVLLTKMQRVLGQTFDASEASARLSLSDIGSSTPSFPIFTYDELAPGILIHDRFRIDSNVGEGGMGKVLKARDEKLEEWVVIKVMKTSLAEDARSLAHFKREIRLARRITHPGVVRIYDFWEAGPLKFVTMEYLEGEDLRKVTRQRGVFPFPVAVRVAGELFEALAVAHGEGVVHRDIKPHNILMMPSGRIKVLDFGIAQGLEADQADGATITNSIVGTPEYMSPEQLSGSRVDARTDLYSAGLVLYEMVTGELPFSGPNRMVIATKRLHEEPMRPSAKNPEIPIELEAVILNLLHRDREKRYPTARGVVEELKNIRS